jgi:hypothetical protein
VTGLDDVREEIDLGTGPGESPTALSVNLLSPGFMLNFPKGFALHLKSTSAPYLSWRDASVGEHVPTPPVHWIAVSFKQGQPPIVLGFLDNLVSLQVDGQVGDWTIRTQSPYRGWVRIALPFGTQPLATDSAATLGKLSVSVAEANELWWQPAPRLKGTIIQDEDTAIEATWQFDRKGAIVPRGAALANLGAYPLSIKSKTHRLDGYTEEGPTTICDEDSLTIRFPINRVPLGRSITVGSPAMEPIGTVSAFDVGGIVELAFENLLAARDERSRKTAEDAVAELIQETQYSLEPHTNQSLPYGADGKGIDSAAANALLYQAYTMSTKPTSQDNSLLTSVTWRRDWYSWMVWTPETKESRRAGAFAALAGALCPEPERRLEAAMCQAGLAADRGLGIFFARSARKPEPKYLEPIWTVRNTVFDMVQTPRHPSAFADTLLGVLRIFGDPSVRCTNEPGKGLKIVWTDPASITLASGYPLTVGGNNILGRHFLGYTSVNCLGVGDHVADLTLPPWARKLPSFVAPPRYEEPEN